MSTWTYRPALDGLRTLAVYLVLLFHVGVERFTGGFVGVDLFFVLSGFLVSTILFEELERTGRLDLARFYDRRVRRLLPAAVLLVVAACGVAFVVLSTVRRAPLVADAQAALLYVANWRFLLRKNDYFGAGDVDSSLFLHFWSLSIEEQFYVVFPLLLIVLWRAERRRRGGVVQRVHGRSEDDPPVERPDPLAGVGEDGVRRVRADLLAREVAAVEQHPDRRGRPAGPVVAQVLDVLLAAARPERRWLPRGLGGGPPAVEQPHVAQVPAARTRSSSRARAAAASTPSPHRVGAPTWMTSRSSHATNSMPGRSSSDSSSWTAASSS
jgi:hypothetical protein